MSQELSRIKFGGFLKSRNAAVSGVIFGERNFSVAEYMYTLSTLPRGMFCVICVVL